LEDDMTTATRTESAAPREATANGPVTRRLAVTALAAMAVNVVLAQALRAVTGTSSDFLPMQPGPVAIATLVGVAAGGVLYLVLRRFLRRPVPVFVGLVVLGALLSLGGPLSMLGASPADQPGVTDRAALSLVPLHLVPAAAVLLAVVGRRRNAGRTSEVGGR
jgi:hypothetical protein